MKKIAKIEVIDPGSAPDIDSDFNTEYREKAIEHVSEIYGHNNVANIVTFGTFAGKAAFKQMCTIYEVNFALANKITSLYPPMIEGVSATLEDIYNPDSDRYAEGADFREAVSGKEWEKVIAGARAIEGRNKNTGVHACFTAETLIQTSKGYRSIIDIKVGEYVLTHKNKYQKVVSTMTTKDKELFSLSAYNSLPVKVSGNHPLYVRSIQETTENGTIQRVLSDPYWKNVDELVKGSDLIGSPVNNENKLPENFDLPFADPDFWWIAGYFLNNGSLEESGLKKNIIITVEERNPARDLLIGKINQLFSHKSEVREVLQTDKIYITANNDLFEYFKTFGEEAENREVPNEIISLPSELLENFIQGYLTSNGYRHEKNNDHIFSSVNKKLTLGMTAAINKVYKTHCVLNVEKQDDIAAQYRGVNSGDRYFAFFNSSLIDNKRSFYEDGYIWAHIKNVEKISEQELTYNLSVDEDNSYIANGLTAHNCGIIISNVPLSEAIPLHVRQSDQRTITQWTYPECESLGLIKMDFLGLDTVDLVQNSVENIRKMGKTPPNMIDLIHGDMDDPEVYKMFQEGNTIGIFQFGSDMVRQLLTLTKPTEFADIPAITSVARPGPMGMQSHIKYADRKNGREEIDYIHPEFKGTVMEEILGKTYGLCIPAGTPILDTTTGKYTPIEELNERVSSTPSYNHSTGIFENKTVNKIFATGEKKIIKITLNGNRTLRVSETHPVLTSRGYVEAGNIKTSDRIVVNDKASDVEVEATISEDKAYFLGAMLGDGSFTSDNQPYFTNNEESIINEIARIAETEFNGVFADIKPARVSGNKTRCPVVVFRNYPLNERANYRHLSKKSNINNWFAELGYERKVLMYDKYISEQLFNQPNSVLRNVVAGLWDTDGTVSRSAIHFTTTSQQLHTTMQQALQRLGVDYGVVETPYKNNKRADRTAYRIYPVYVDFEEKIQPYLRSQKRREATLGRTKVASNGLIIFYDQICKDFYDWMKENNKLDLLSHSGLGIANSTGRIGWKAGATYLNAHHGTNITTRIGFVEHLIENNMIAQETLFNINNRYRRVVDVEDDGIELCYDIEVADNHNFVVNGFVVHNCIYQEQVQQISNKIAGMTLQEGDDLRRAMGKKKKKVMDAMRPKFYQGAMNNGFSEAAIDELWGTLEPFAKYGFNKCLYGRTLVSLSDGTKASIEDLYVRTQNGENVEILSMFEDGSIKPHKVSKIVKTGVKPLYKIKTKSGRIIRLTKEHRLLTTSGYGTIEDGVLSEGVQLIVDEEWTKRISEETRRVRQENMTKLNQTDAQREKAREWMKKYQASLSYAERSAHQKNIQLNNPERSVNGLKAMRSTLKDLWENDTEWQNRTLANNQKSRDQYQGLRRGIYGVPTILSDGRVADSMAEAAAAEYLLSRGIDFELHKRFVSVNNTVKVTDFYVDGLYFEMDGLRRGREYFVKEKYGKDIPFVYMTPDNFGDVIDEALLNHHIQNGDEIVEILEPKILENGSTLREMTYDIEMDTTGPANFIANGIVSHNSHAVAYAMNSYQSAYLKVHYPVEFMSALIAQHVDNKDKVLLYLRDAKRMGLKIGSTDINLSDTRVSPNFNKKNDDEYDIIFGLSGVKSVSSNMAEIIVKEREENGLFTSVKDVIDRCFPLGVDKKTVYENLALSGAFDCFGVSRKLAFENIVNLMDESKTKVKKGESLFDMFEVEDDSLEVELTGEDYPFLTKLKMEAAMIGLYLTAHPTDKVGNSLKKDNSQNISQLMSSTSSRPIRTTVISAVLGMEVKRSRRGAKSITLDLDDGSGFITANVGKHIVAGIDKYNAQMAIRDAYEKGKNDLKEELLTKAVDPAVQVVKDIQKYDLYMIDLTFRAAKDDSPYRAQINSIKPLQLADDGSLPVRIRFRLTEENREKMERIRKGLPYNLDKKMPGNSPIYTVAYDENELFVDDKILYETAYDLAKLNTEEKELVWPPKLNKKSQVKPSREDIINAIENLEYQNSGFTTDKSQRVEQAIEKYVGYGAYDFGIFNENSLEDD